MRLPEFHRQSADHTCGPAALRMLLAFHGIRRTERALERVLRTTEATGTTRRALIRSARGLGLRVRAGGMTLADLETELSAGHPVLVNYVEPSEEVGHFAIVTSCTPTTVILADPWNGERFSLARREFARRWFGHRTRDPRRGWGMVASPKEERASRRG